MFNGNKDIWCRQFLMEIKIFDVNTINTHTIEYIVRFFLLWLSMWSFPGTWNSPQTVTTQLLNRASDNLIFKTHEFTSFVPLINILTVRKRKIHHFFFLVSIFTHLSTSLTHWTPIISFWHVWRCQCVTHCYCSLPHQGWQLPMYDW